MKINFEGNMRLISNILPSKQVRYFHEILLSHLLPCQCCGFSSERAADHWPGEAEPAIELSVKLRFGKKFLSILFSNECVADRFEI